MILHREITLYWAINKRARKRIFLNITVLFYPEDHTNAPVLGVLLVHAFINQCYMPNSKIPPACTTRKVKSGLSTMQNIYKIRTVRSSKQFRIIESAESRKGYQHNASILPNLSEWSSIF